MAGDLREIERTGGIDHHLIVDRHPRERGDGRARGDDDILRAIGFPRDIDAVRAGKSGMALQPLHLVLLQQKGDAAGQLLYRLCLFGMHGVEMELDLTDLDAELGERALLGFLEQFGGVQERLGRDAADIEAGAPQSLAALDASRAQAKLAGTDGGHIAAGPGADHDYVIVEFSVSHFIFLVPRRRPGSRSGPAFAGHETLRGRSAAASGPRLLPSCGPGR